MQDSEDDYLVDHSIITYLVNPEVRPTAAAAAAAAAVPAAFCIAGFHAAAAAYGAGFRAAT